MPERKNTITARFFLDHMQGMEQRLTQRIDTVDTKIERAEKTLDAKIERVEKTLGRKIDLLSVQIGNIDARLDDIEVVQIPKVKKAIGFR